MPACMPRPLMLDQNDQDQSRKDRIQGTKVAATLSRDFGLADRCVLSPIESVRPATCF